MFDQVGLLNSVEFARTMFGIAIVCLILAIGTIVIAFSFYGRTRDVFGTSPEKQRWTLLMGTWRDSLIITLLYTAEGFVYRFSAFGSLLESHGASPLPPSYLVSPIFNLVTTVLIFTVTIMRIIVISKWLADQRDMPEG